jgi:hypothetical protein
MMVHLVRLGQSSRDLQFEFIGAVNPAQERTLIDTINHFYQVTGDLYLHSNIPAIYSIYLDKAGGNNFQKKSQIHLNPRNLTQWTVTHELAHSLDSAHGWGLSRMMKKHTRSGFLCKALHLLRPTWKLFWYGVGSPPPPCGVDKNFNALEDFAETVTAYIFPDEAYQRATARGYPYEKWGYTHFYDTPRGRFLADLISSNKQTALYA